MRTLNIDIETYSPVNLKDCGLFAYAAHPDFEILLFAYCFDDGPVECVDFTAFEGFPREVLLALDDPNVLKTAHNAPFEMVCIQRWLNDTYNSFEEPHCGLNAFDLGCPMLLDPSQWECTSVKSAMVGLPMSLDAIPKALNMEQQKDREGKALINFFCVPCKPTKANGMRTRNYPEHAPEKWAKFKAYNINDVVTERAIRERISFFDIPESEKTLWKLDQKINAYGVRVAPVLVKNAIRIDAEYKEELTREAVNITGLDNPNSIAQLKTWLTSQLGKDIDSLTKDNLKELLKRASGDAKRMLAIRQELGKTSVKKYNAMENGLGKGNRIRGLLQFYGAGRTGRWAGRMVQVQNLPRNKMGTFDKELNVFYDTLDIARRLVYDNDGEMLEMIFGNVPDALSQLVRTAFIPSEGHVFRVADFSAIEARVIAWIAGEKWRMEVFNTHGKIYEASASKMFKVPIESIGKGSPLRDKGKVSELALGYQGGPGALIQMGALEMGVCDEAVRLGKIEVENWAKMEKLGLIRINQRKPIAKGNYEIFIGGTWQENQNIRLHWNEEAEEFYQMRELAKLVKMWRNENKNVVQFWYDCQDAALNAIDSPGEVFELNHGLSFQVEHNVLFITLPSGRKLCYWNPEIVEGKFGPSIQYWGLDQVKKIWRKIDTYGGKICENIVQGIARDCLAEALINLDAAGYKICMHVHDEVILDVPEGFGSQEEVNAIMGREIPWAKGLPLGAESYDTYYYKKD